jgi:hypothetical protein
LTTHIVTSDRQFWLVEIDNKDDGFDAGRSERIGVGHVPSFLTGPTGMDDTAERRNSGDAAPGQRDLRIARRLFERSRQPLDSRSGAPMRSLTGISVATHANKIAV